MQNVEEFHPQAYLDYILRVGAEITNFRKAIVKKYNAKGYYHEKTIIKVSATGEVTCDDASYLPTKEEAENIRHGFSKIEFPASMDASQAELQQLIKEFELDPKNVFPLLNFKTGNIRMVQYRWEQEDKPKAFVPYSFYSDKKWRRLECDGALPFWKPAKQNRIDIMVHEGAKAARYCDWLCYSDEIEARRARELHPWVKELSQYDHWGIIGGALAPHRADYAELNSASPVDVVYTCDNDDVGKHVLQTFSKHYGNRLKGIKFDNRFPDGWDLADPLPEAFFNMVGGKRFYKGPALRTFLTPATRATEVLPNPTGKGRPITVLRRDFRDEWSHTIDPETYIHKDWPHELWTDKQFNALVSPFSDVDDTAKLLRAVDKTKAKRLHYIPGQKPGFYGSEEEGQFINTFCPSHITPIEGDPAPFLDFLEMLIPDDSDRHEVMRWSATLIARPGIKMLYGMLFISERQGVGKTTLGEKILAPLVGYRNVSFPSESDIVESQFNSWIGHKRLAIVNEIYAGSSAKAYNKLKSVITDRIVTINKKFMSAYEMQNWLHVFACSNSDRALKLSLDDRRWFVPRITEETRPADYWSKFNSWLENENGLAIIAHWAHVWLLDNRGVMQGETSPDSVAKREMIEGQYSPGMELVSTVLNEIKETGDSELFVTDRMLVDLIKKRLYDGREVPHLEKPATLRKLAKNQGWHIGSEGSRVWSADKTKARIVSMDAELAKRDPQILHKEGKRPFDLNDLAM